MEFPIQDCPKNHHKNIQFPHFIFQSVKDTRRTRLPLPQLAEFSDPDPPFMNLLQLHHQGRPRQAVDTNGDPSFLDTPDSSDDEVRCIPKVMQVSSQVGG